MLNYQRVIVSNTGILMDVPSGKRLYNRTEHHHFVAGTTHYFDCAIFHGYVTNQLPEGKHLAETATGCVRKWGIPSEGPL